MVTAQHDARQPRGGSTVCGGGLESDSVGRVLSIFDGPDYLNLRKAGRAVVVCPVLMVVCLEVLDNSTIALYSFFASFVPLVFSDYGGPRRRRAGAYCSALIGGLGMVVLGAALAWSMVAAAVGGFVVMFAATFATAFGGYRALHVAPLALAYAISALEPLSDLGLADRVAGWTLGCATALLAAVVMWPIDRRGGLQSTAAALAGDLATSVRSLRDPSAERSGLARVRNDSDSLEASLATPLRPYGPARRDISFVHLVEHLVDAVDIVEALLADGAAVDDALVDGIADSLERAATMLATGEVDATTDDELHELDRAREVGQERLQREAARRAEESAGAATMLRSIPLLSLSHVVVWIEVDAARVVGDAESATPELSTAPEVRSTAPADDLRSRARRSLGVVRAELDPDGVILRNSVRAGIALAASVVVADVLPVEHGFWIVLATLLVLHSGAHSTYATAVGAVAGTLIGIAVGVVLALASGDVSWLQWVLFPIVVFTAGYFPGGINFVAGQAAFGLLVIVLFELLDDPGAQTAVIRVETVAAGALTATVLSLVLWPRGARAAIAASVAEVYRAAADATSTFVRGDGHAPAYASEIVDADRRAEASFAVALCEHSEPIDARAWARILAPATMARALVIGLVPTVDHEPAGCGRALAAAERRVEVVSARLAAVAAVLAGGELVPGPSAPGDLGELEACVDACASDVDEMAEALLVVAWWAMLGRLDDAIERPSDALDEVTAASHPRAWLVGPLRRHTPS